MTPYCPIISCKPYNPIIDYREFVPIEGFDYEVNRMGQIRKQPNPRNSFNPKVLKTWKNNSGYEMVAFSYDHKIYRKTVHRLVATTFIPNPYNKEDVNHINGNKSDNCVNNLEWTTRSENIRHAFDTGLRSMTDSTREKLSIAKQKPVELYKDGKYIRTFATTNECAEFLNCRPNSITSSCSKGDRLFGYTVKRVS